MDRKLKVSDYAVITDLLADQPCFECTNRLSFPLHRAAVSGHIQCMKQIFASLKDADTLLDSENSTPLHAAASAGQIECLKFLLDYTRIPVRHQNFQGETCVHVSALNHQLESLKVLLGGSFKKAQSLAFIKDNLGCTVLHCAVLVNDNDIALWLLQRFGKNIANISNEEYVLPLHAAAAQGNIEFIRIATKYDAQMVNKRDKNGATAAFYAVQGGYLLCLKYLVEKAKADIRMVTKRGQSLVHAACLNGHVDIVEWLFTILDRSFVCQQTRDAATPFHCAAYGGHESVLRLLHKISGGKRLLVLLTDRRGNTALHLAALKGHIDCADLLLKIGADPEVRNKNGHTPIDIAEKRKFVDLSHLLLASADGSQIVNGNKILPDSFILRNSLHLVRPNSMSTSGYSSTAAPSEPYELAASGVNCRRRIEVSSGYTSSSSGFLKRQKIFNRNPGVSWKAKSVSVREKNEDRIVLAYDNWLLRRKEASDHSVNATVEPKVKVAVQRCKSQPAIRGSQHLVDSQIQTDFDPLVDNIIIVDDDERIIFSSVTSIPTVFNSVNTDKTTESTNSLESCFIDANHNHQQLRVNRISSRQTSLDQSSSDSDLRETGSDFHTDVKSVSTCTSSTKSDSVEGEMKTTELAHEAEIENSPKLDNMLRRELEDSVESDDYDSGIISNATNTVLTVVQQSVEKVTTVRNGSENVSRIQKAGHVIISKSLIPHSATLSQTSFATISSVEPRHGPILALPFLHEDQVSGDSPVAVKDCETCETVESIEPTLISVENDKLQRESSVRSNGSAKSISLTDLSGIASRLSSRGIKSDLRCVITNNNEESLVNYDNINSNDHCATEKYNQQKDCNEDLWNPPARQQRPDNSELPQITESRRGYRKEQKTVMFKHSFSPMSRALSTEDRERCRSKVAEIRKRLEEHFSVAQHYSRFNNAQCHPIQNKTGNNCSSRQESNDGCKIDEEIDHSSHPTNFRYFGTSNGSDNDLRKNIRTSVGGKANNHPPAGISNGKKILKETDIDNDILVMAKRNNISKCEEQAYSFSPKAEISVQVS